MQSKTQSEKDLPKPRLFSEVVVIQPLVGTDVVPGDYNAMMDGTRDRQLLLLQVLLCEPIYLHGCIRPQLFVNSPPCVSILTTTTSYFWIHILNEKCREKEEKLVNTNCDEDSL